MTTYKVLPELEIQAALANPAHRSMRSVMRALGLNIGSSSASTKLLKFAQVHGIDLSRFTAGRRVNLVGKRFGKLVVERRVKSRYRGQQAWKCRCDCGKLVVYVSAVVLRSQHCGCGQYANGQKHWNWQGYREISQRYWGQVKHGAQVRSIVFDLKIESAWDIYERQQRRCALSGLEIGFKGGYQGTASLDRVDATEGYVDGNVQWVHKDVNRMKSDFSEEHFFNLVKVIYEHKFIEQTGAGFEQTVAGD
jgi:hypothetical protein